MNSHHREARYYGAGEQVHQHYAVRAGHEIYTIEVQRFVAPQEWLASVQRRG